MSQQAQQLANHDQNNAPHQPPEVQASRYQNIVIDLCQSARNDGYRGYNKHDGLNSPFLRLLSKPHKFLRLVATQTVMRAPINVRPWLGVPKTINAKGMALWAITYLNLYQSTHDDAYLKYAEDCLTWLTENNSMTGYSGYCWGYPYPWQDAGFFAPVGMPNCVVSCFVGRAFLLAYGITQKEQYLKIVRSLCDFLLNDLTKIFSSDDMMCLSYAPVDMDWVVMDTSALSSVVLAKTAAASGETQLQNEAFRLMNYVVDKKTDYDAWFYSHPPQRSHITHDNYHTGYIVDAILDYSDASGDNQFMDDYWQGLAFYQKHLFEPDGAPRWMHDKKLPYDIHGAAQGIISFSKAAKKDHTYLQQAQKCAQWAVDNMYVEQEHRFRYQKRRFFSKNYTLLRWCNAWMARALSMLLSDTNK